MKFAKLFLLVFIIALVIFYIKNPVSNYYTINGETFGTYYSVKINTSRENNLLGKQIKEELELINKRMSVFDNNSEISQINHAQAGVWIPLSDEMAELMKTTKTVYDQSKGYFDPTVGKLVDLWGFGTTNRTTIPTEAQIKDALKTTGFNKLEFSPDFKQVKKLSSDVSINLSAVAKGYGVDKIYELLDQQGYSDFVVEIGGEVRAKGKRAATASGWNIGISDPQTKDNTYIISLSNQAVATSGDYENFYEIDGQKYSHTISPITGHPVQNSLASVTVFKSDCATADALATALMAMGYPKALSFANRNNLAVVFYLRTENDTLSVTSSDAATNLIKKKGLKK